MRRGNFYVSLQTSCPIHIIVNVSKEVREHVYSYEESDNASFVSNQGRNACSLSFSLISNENIIYVSICFKYIQIQ